MAELGRLLTAMVTPFDEGGQVDYAQARRLASALLDSGSDGLVVTGTTGESPTLTSEEKVRLWAEVKDEVKGRGTVIAGSGSYCTAESVELTKEAEKLGVDAALLVVPYYNKPPQEGCTSTSSTSLETPPCPASSITCPAVPSPTSTPTPSSG